MIFDHHRPDITEKAQQWKKRRARNKAQKEGWTYLAYVEDLYSRKIISWAFGEMIDAELAANLEFFVSTILA